MVFLPVGIICVANKKKGARPCSHWEQNCMDSVQPIPPNTVTPWHVENRLEQVINLHKTSVEMAADKWSIMKSVNWSHVEQKNEKKNMMLALKNTTDTWVVRWLKQALTLKENSPTNYSEFQGAMRFSRDSYNLTRLSETCKTLESHNNNNQFNLFRGEALHLCISGAKIIMDRT